MFRMFKSCWPDSNEAREFIIASSDDDDDNNQKLTESQDITTDSESNQILDEDFSSIIEKKKKKSQPKNITYMESFKNLSGFSIPTALSFTFSIEIFLVALLIHRMTDKDEELASTALIVTMLNYIAVGMSFLFAMSFVASRHIGEMEAAEKDDDLAMTVIQKEHDIAQVYKAGMLLALPLSAASLTPLVFSKPVLELFQQDKMVAANAEKFLKIFSIAVPGLFARLVAEQMMLSTKKQKEAMIIGLISLGVGTGVAIWLAHGGLGIEPMGLKGIAAGFAMEAWLTAIAYTMFIGIAPDLRRYHFFDITQLDGIWEQIKNILTIGQSIFFSMATEISMNLAMGFLAGAIGVRPQAAITYIMQYSSFVFLFSLAFAQGCAQEISRYVGAKDYQNASLYGRYGLLTSFMWLAPIPLLFSIKPDLLLQTTVRNRNELEYMLKFLSPILSVALVADGLRYNLLQQLRSIGDINGPTFFSISMLTSGMVVAGVTGLKTNAGIYGLAGGYAGGILAAYAGLKIRWATTITPKKIMKSIEDKPEENNQRCFGLLDNFFQRFNGNKEAAKLITNTPTYSTAGMGNTG